MRQFNIMDEMRVHYFMPEKETRLETVGGSRLLYNRTKRSQFYLPGSTSRDAKKVPLTDYLTSKHLISLLDQLVSKL